MKTPQISQITALRVEIRKLSRANKSKRNGQYVLTLRTVQEQEQEQSSATRTTRTTRHARVTDDIPFVKEFETFWDSYPRREAKMAAKKAWCARVKVVPPETLVLAAKHYATASY